MDWLTWQQGAAIAASSATASFVVQRVTTPSPHSSSLAAKVQTQFIAATKEISFVAGLYTLWRLARVLPLDQSLGAIERGKSLESFQREIFLPSELSLQKFVLEHEWLAQVSNAYYAIAHVPVLLIFLVWLFAFRRNAYPKWRNGLALLTAMCLSIRFIRVAPPRFFPELGYIDLSTRYGMSVYGPVGKGVSDQFAAMPSIHVGWAAVVSFGIVATCTSKWRWLGLFHVVATIFVVSATGNHWWLDGFVAIVLLGIALFVDERFIRPRRG
jgi:hypothetical protein